MTGDELDKLITDAGVGGRTAKKLREAHAKQQIASEPAPAPKPTKAKATSPTKPKKAPVLAGHGAPRPGNLPRVRL